jgi:hypothetical protein
VDSLVKVGDYYYHGLGVSDPDDNTRLEKAARYYLTAANTQTSALAMWNLGWMYENGMGVPQVSEWWHCVFMLLVMIALPWLGFPPCKTVLRYGARD